MKKAMLRKLRAMSEEIIGKEETNKILDETISEILEETKPKKTDVKKTNKKGYSKKKSDK